jgi:TRAP-type uncharacterized transport system fused permease subunit
MFIFYFGLVSAITPPVALAAYAAAGIAGTDANATAWEAIRLGFVKLLVPFAFVTMPGLLMIGSVLQIALSVVLASIAASGLSVAFAGWLARPLTAVERAAFAVASLLTLWPTPVDATDPLTLAARLLGLTVLAITIVRIAAGAARPLPGATRN